MSITGPVKFLSGNYSDLPQERIPGTIHFCEDTGEMYVDTDSLRRHIVDSSKVNKNYGVMNGNLNMNGNTIENISSETLDTILSYIADKMLPIGTILMFHETEEQTRSSLHMNFLGLQWERVLQGSFPLGMDWYDGTMGESQTPSTGFCGEQGGEREHTLTVEEVPQLQKRGVIASVTQNDDDLASPYYDATAQPHNNMPPYKVVTFWKRIA